jgi:hypothetical protein
MRDADEKEQSMNPLIPPACSVARHVAAATVNATVLVTGPCRFMGTNYRGPSTSRWLKIYDLATNPATTDTPIMSLRTASSASATTGAPEGGIWCENGIAIRITANAAEDDDTAVSAGDVVVQIYYQRG